MAVVYRCADDDCRMGVRCSSTVRFHRIHLSRLPLPAFPGVATTKEPDGRGHDRRWVPWEIMRVDYIIKARRVAWDRPRHSWIELADAVSGMLQSALEKPVRKPGARAFKESTGTALAKGGMGHAGDPGRRDRTPIYPQPTKSALGLPGNLCRSSAASGLRIARSADTGAAPRKPPAWALRLKPPRKRALNSDARWPRQRAHVARGGEVPRDGPMTGDTSARSFLHAPHPPDRQAVAVQQDRGRDGAARENRRA